MARPAVWLSERLAQPLHLIPQEGDFIRGFGVVSIHNKTRYRSHEDMLKNR
jgi:hypothetical protein